MCVLPRDVMLLEYHRKREQKGNREYDKRITINTKREERERKREEERRREEERTRKKMTEERERTGINQRNTKSERER